MIGRGLYKGVGTRGLDQRAAASGAAAAGPADTAAVRMRPASGSAISLSRSWLFPGKLRPFLCYVVNTRGASVFSTSRMPSRCCVFFILAGLVLGWVYAIGQVLGAGQALPEPAGPASRRSALVISEIHYHPRPGADSNNLEFIELSNSQLWQEDLSGFRLS